MAKSKTTGKKPAKAKAKAKATPAKRVVRQPLRFPVLPPPDLPGENINLPEDLFAERASPTFAYPMGGGVRIGEAKQEPTISARTGRRDRGSFDRVTSTRRVHQLTALKRRARSMGSEYARAVLLAQSFVKMPDESDAAERGWREMRMTSDRFKPDFIASFGSSASKIRSLSRVRVRGTR